MSDDVRNIVIVDQKLSRIVVVERRSEEFHKSKIHLCLPIN